MTPVTAFYHRPSTIQDIVDQTVNRSLDLLGVSSNGISSSDGKEHQSRGQVRAVVNQMQLNSRKERNPAAVSTGRDRMTPPVIQRSPKLILEGTRLTSKTDLVLALNENRLRNHPRT